MTELSSQTRVLLELARSSDGPTETDCERLAGSLATKVGIAAPILLGGAAVGALPHAGATATAGLVAGGASVASGLSAPSLLSSAGVKVVLAALAGATVGVATMAPVVMLSPDPAEAQPVQPAEPALVEGRLAAANAPGRALEHPAIPAVAGAVREPVQGNAPIAALGAPGTPVRSKAAASLAREAELLAAVQSDLRDDEPERALALLDEHERAYSGGALSEERRAARVLALCQAGQRDAARRLAIEFLAAAPRSPLVPRIQSSCAFAALAPEPSAAKRSASHE
jgi:hypothetical protein